MSNPLNGSPSRRVIAALAAGVLAVAACRDQDPALMKQGMAAAGEPNTVVETSALTAAPGEDIAVAVRVSAPSGVALNGVQGTLNFNADRLSYVGQSLDEAHPVMVFVNEQNAEHGSIRFVTVNPKGLDPRAAVFAFKVKGGAYTSGLNFVFEGAVAGEAELTKARAVGVQMGLDLTAKSVVHGLTQADWLSRLAPELVQVQLTPGQYRTNLLYGDATADGNINVSDVLHLANIAVGNRRLLDTTERDAVIAGNVRPTNDGPGAVRPDHRPGLDTASTSDDHYGFINVADVSAVANGAVGNPVAVVGSPIPGRGADQFGPNLVVVNTDITSNVTWTKNNTYQVGDAGHPHIYVTNNATLTIEPGTRIEGWYGSYTGSVGSNQGTLVIKRDGWIVAQGTDLEPITMTCKLPNYMGPRSEPAGTRWPGCWGGLTIAGNATINSDDPNAVPGTGVPGRTGAGAIQTQDEIDASIVFGGNNDDDSSGILKYVRVEYGGSRETTTKERNNITFNGVGRHTVVDYIQSYASLDDGTEFFGGTVNIKHVMETANEDDNVDWVLGWRGAGQFIVVQADSVDGDRCVEGDNNGIDAGDPDRTPRSNPTIYNITCAGKLAPVYYSSITNLPASCHTQLNALSAAQPNCVDQAFLFRQNTAATVRNAIAYRYSRGLDFDKPNGAVGGGVTLSDVGLCTQLAAAPANPGIGAGLSFRYALISLGTATINANGSPGATVSIGPDNDGSDPGATATSCAGFTAPTYTGSNLEALYVADANNHITTFTNDAAAGDYLMDPLNLMAPDFRPRAGMAAVTSETAPNPGTVNGLVFEDAPYMGGVSPANGAGSNIPWYSGWTRGWTTPTQK